MGKGISARLVKTIMVLSLVVAPLGSLKIDTLATETKEWQLAREIIQTPRDLQITEAALISYYPGVLMRFTGPPIRDVEMILETSHGEFDIKFGRIDHEESGEYVLIAFRSGDGYIIGASTILVIGPDGSYSSAETDIGFLTRSAGKSVNIQEQVRQVFKQSWSQHYRNLRTVVQSLSLECSSSRNPELREVAKTYLELADLLTDLRTIVLGILSSYDKTIDEPYAMIFVEQKESLRAGAQLVDEECIGVEVPYVASVGWARSWYIDRGDSIWHDVLYDDASMHVGGTGGTITITMDYYITTLSYRLILGLGTAYKIGGVGKKYVAFALLGLATWELLVASMFREGEFPHSTYEVGLTARDEHDTALDYARLRLYPRDDPL